MDFVLFNGYYGVDWIGVEWSGVLKCVLHRLHSAGEIFSFLGERFLPTDCRDGCELETEGWKTETGFITGYRSLGRCLYGDIRRNNRMSN